MDHGAEGLVWRRERLASQRGLLLDVVGHGQRAGQVLAQDGLRFVVLEKLFSVFPESAAGEGRETQSDPFGQESHLFIRGGR